MDLTGLRCQIDQIDEEIYELFLKRTVIVQEVAKFKHKNNIPIFQEERELEKLSKFNNEDFKKILNLIFELSKEKQNEYISKK